MLRKFRRTVNQLIRRVLLIRISEAFLICEEGFFTEWKLGNTPNEKPRDPAFGGVFFCLRIKKERFLTPLLGRGVSCVSSLHCCCKHELAQGLYLSR